MWFSPNTLKFNYKDERVLCCYVSCFRVAWNLKRPSYDFCFVFLEFFCEIQVKINAKPGPMAQVAFIESGKLLVPCNSMAR